MLKFSKNNWFIILTFTVLLVICIWLIKIDYFNYAVELDKLLPANTKLSATLDMSELNATINQKNKLIKNNTLGAILDTINNEVRVVANEYNTDWTREMQGLIEPEIVFFITEKQDEWGVLAKANNKKLLTALQNSGDLIIAKSINDFNIYQLTTKQKPPIYFSFINGKIISISGNEDIVKESLFNYTNHSDSSWQQRFSIISLEPILKIKIDPNAELQTFGNELLGNVYAVLTPIITSSSTDLFIEFDQTGNFLTWQITNIASRDFEANYNKNTVANNLTYINFKPTMMFASYKPNQLQEEIIVNNPIWTTLSKFSSTYMGTDLPNHISSQTNKGILIAFDEDNNLFAVFNKTDLESITSTIYEVLGKQNPRPIEKILPDGTKYFELMADETYIQERTSIIGNKTITTIFAPNATSTYNYYVDENIIVLSNNYEALVKNLSSHDSVRNQCLYKANFAELLYLDSTIDNSIINALNLDKFTLYDQSYDKNIVIKGCLRL